MWFSSFFFYGIITVMEGKNSMKKIMKVLCVFALVFLAGCSSTNSQDEQKQVVTDFFTYVSECDIKNLKKITSSSVLNDMELEKMEEELSQYTEEEYGKVFVEETDKFKYLLSIHEVFSSSLGTNTHVKS